MSSEEHVQAFDDLGSARQEKPLSRWSERAPTHPRRPCLSGRPADQTGRWPCPRDRLVGTGLGRLQAKPGRLPGALVGGEDGVESGAARRGEGAGLAGFGIAENMFYMFSAMLF
jgi:hypothetical protein